MLFTKSVDPKLLEFLNRLMEESSLDDFYLVGGTALSLHLGHRMSDDIDLFGHCQLNEGEINEILSDLGQVIWLTRSKNILIATVHGIKVDFVNYRYPWLRNPTTQDSLRLASREDIAAMKLNAIAGRGSKKDFVDLYFLLQVFTLAEMIGFYTKKFKDGSAFMVLKSLTYFKDADLQKMPIMFDDTLWDTIKSTIRIAVEEYIKKS